MIGKVGLEEHFAIPETLLDSAGFVPGDYWPHLRRWFDAISARPAAIRVNVLKDRFTFKTEMDREARRIMFPHIVKP